MLETTAVPLAVLVFPGGIFALLAGLMLKGLDRRLAARLQGRVGPPLAQPLYDLVKLARKRTMVPDIAAEPVFLGAPLIGAASMLLAAALVPIAGVYAPNAMLGDLLVLLYLLAVPAVVLMIAGSASGSPFGAVGFSREMALMLAYEGPLVLVVAAVALRAGSFSLNEIIAYQHTHRAFLFDPMMWPALAAFLAFYPANLGIIPFDIPEAETEVLEGPLLEYSGPALGLFKVMSALKAVVVLSLGIALFWPSTPGAAPVVLSLLVHVAKLVLLMSVGVTFLRVSTGRMRIDQAFRFFLRWPLALSVLSLLIVVLV